MASPISGAIDSTRMFFAASTAAVGWIESVMTSDLSFDACAGLLIDYGHDRSSFGDTLQAVAAHRYIDPLAAPGEADLSLQVDFAALAAALHDAGLASDGPAAQGEFLGRLGIVERASRLMAANPTKAAEIEASVARLIAPQGMGTRFRALGLRSPALPPLPGLAPVDMPGNAP